MITLEIMIADGYFRRRTPLSSYVNRAKLHRLYKLAKASEGTVRIMKALQSFQAIRRRSVACSGAGFPKHGS